MENQIPQPAVQKTRSNVVRAALFAILLSLIVFSAGQTLVIYETLEITNQTLAKAYDQQLVLTRNYTHLYQETESMLAATSQELASAKTVLGQTEALLAQVKQENITLRSQLSSLDTGNGFFTEKLSQLQMDQIKSYDDIETIKNQMQSWTGRVRNIDEGRDVISMFQNKIQAVKLRILEIKRQAVIAKKEALKERDRIALLNGNQGLMIKNGDVFVPPTATAQAPKPQGGIKIDVSFYEPTKINGN